MISFSLRESRCPIVTGTTTLFWHPDIFQVIQTVVLRLVYTLNHTGFKVEQHRSWNVMFIIGLVKENIFSITSLDSKVLKNTIWSDAVFKAQLFPKFVRNLVSTLPNLQCDEFPGHTDSCTSTRDNLMQTTITTTTTTKQQQSSNKATATTTTLATMANYDNTNNNIKQS
eukprot:m.160808 g.160808  ORF g.160808 m.160808 type:complete len:170 (-) comp15175_c2_seq1:30-539(-)